MVSIEVLCADALDVLREMPDDSIDALVTDPPAGIAFMGKNWDDPSAESWGTFDSPYARRATPRDGTNGTRDIGNREKFIASLTPIFAECLRVMKPGAHGVVWALPRTSHWTATALEDAGFEIRDVVVHLFGSGFPKSLDVSKAIDKAAGAKRKKWSGWGTALKPASEHWILVRKPLAEKNVAANVVKYGTGALNIDACRIGTNGEVVSAGIKEKGNRVGEVGSVYFPASDTARFQEAQRASLERTNTLGRWPANVVLSHHPLCEMVGERIVADGGLGGSRPARGIGDEDGNETQEAWDCIPGCVVTELDAQSGQSVSTPQGIRSNPSPVYGRNSLNESATIHQAVSPYRDCGGASRFYYVAKPSRAEKQDALRRLSLFDADPINKPEKNAHPTVKPVALMRWLIRLVAPSGGKILDPFAGSGTTGVAAAQEGVSAILIEREAESAATAKARCSRALAESGY